VLLYLHKQGQPPEGKETKMETITLNKKSYSAYGIVYELATKIDKLPNRFQVWDSSFEGLDFHEVVGILTAYIESQGIATSVEYFANGVGTANRGTKICKTRDVRFPVSKLIQFGDGAGLSFSQLIA